MERCYFQNIFGLQWVLFTTITIGLCFSTCRVRTRGYPFMTSTQRGQRGQTQMDACGRGEGGQAPCGRPHRKLKVESTDLILSSHAKKLASFSPEFRLSRNKKWKFFGDVN